MQRRNIFFTRRAAMKDCNTENFREKSVVNSCDGRILGHVAEIIFDVCDGRLTAIVVRDDSGVLCFKRFS